MKVSLFIARRLRPGKAKNSFAATIWQIAGYSVGLGACVLVVAFAVLHGFRQQISAKVYSFGAHINVSGFHQAGSYEDLPLSVASPEAKALAAHPAVLHLQSFAYKPALLRTSAALEGIMLKGIGPDFDQKMFAPNIVEGRFFDLKNGQHDNIVISRKQATKLKLGIDSSAVLFFLQDPPRYRKVRISGIYQTGLEEFDESIVFISISQIRSLNGWADSLAGGLEMYIKDTDKLLETQEQIQSIARFDQNVSTITELQPQIFEWLRMIGRNVEILLGLIIIVACFNMVSTLLILILERVRMIGTLKALGAKNSQISMIFVLNGFWLTLKGLIFGNLIGLFLCFIQDKFQLIPLDPENYYIAFVPIAWPWADFLWFNVLIIAVVACSLLLPGLFILRIKPSESIRFD